MTELPPIPVPVSQRWREIRIRYLPVALVTCLVGAAIPLWRSTVAPSNMTGIVESIRADVISPDAGIVTNLFVSQFQEVKAGDIVAEITSTDNRRLDAGIQALRGQLSLTQLRSGTIVDQARLAFDYQALRVEHLKQRVDLETAMAELGPAEEEKTRLERMLKENVGSLQDYTRAARDHAALKARVDQLTPAVAELGALLSEASPVGEAAPLRTGPGLRAALEALEEEQAKLEALRGHPIQLRAPIDGIVLAIHRVVGQNLLEGDPVLTIGAKNGERIIGYLKQPIGIEPIPGTEVKVQSRRSPRGVFWGQVLAVGAQFESITNTALLRADGRPDHGLPVSISLPEPLKTALRPGEVVDLYVKAK